MKPADFVAFAEALANFRDGRAYPYSRREASAKLVAAFSAAGVRSSFVEDEHCHIPEVVMRAANLCASTEQFFAIVPEDTAAHFRRAHEDLSDIAAGAICDWLYPPPPVEASHEREEGATADATDF
jgi:hypothetical protein